MRGLFGIHNSNRDFEKASAWGKNKFNSAFPVALTLYMFDRGIEPVYLVMDEDGSIAHERISFEDLTGVTHADDLRVDFEIPFEPFRDLTDGSLGSIDVVLSHEGRKTRTAMRGLEVKLTALPDDTTDEFDDEEMGAEIVVRPPTVEYLALSIADLHRDPSAQEVLREALRPACRGIRDWSNAEDMAERVTALGTALDSALISNLNSQGPFLLQPVWKTRGKSLRFADGCFDVFVWSNWAMTRLFQDRQSTGRISRSDRTLIWVVKMLWDFVSGGVIDSRDVVRTLDFGTQTDKAFAVSGTVTNGYMSSPELAHPRLRSTALKAIVLGDGYEALSPERRLDAAIAANAPELWDA